MAAAIGYMALAGSERAQVIAAGEGARDGTPSRGRGGLPALLRTLDALEARGETDLAKAPSTASCSRAGRPGMLVAISDFFDPGPVTAALTRAASGGHDVVLVQVVTRDEIEPTFEGDWTLEDAETGAVVDVTMDPAAIEAYVLRFAGLCEELRAWARKHRGAYVRVRTDEPLEGAVRRFVSRSID